MNSATSFAAVLAQVRRQMQSGQLAQALAAIDQALRDLPVDRDKLLFLRLDIARSAGQTAAQADTLHLIGEAARRTTAETSARLVSSLRLRNLPQEAWNLLSQLPARAALAAEAYHLGLDFTRIGQTSSARQCYEYALACKADFAEAHINLGSLLLRDRLFRDAQPHFETAVRLQPRSEAALIGLGQCLLHTGNGKAALGIFAQISGVIADSAQMLAWRATALTQDGDDAAAISLYRQALDRDPRNYDAWFGSALIHERDKNLDAAAQAYARAWALQPQSNWALGSLVFSLQCMADWSRWEAPHAELIDRLTRGNVGDYATALSSLDLSAKALRQVAAQFVRTQSALHVAEVRQRAFPPRKPGRLRVAYVSSDFRDHATSRLLVETLEHHDRERFEVFGFALNPPDGSALGRRVAAACEHFIEITDLPPQEVAKRLRETQVDVLIDLNGHTKGACIGLTALRPAPIIVNYLGYPGTVGDYADYIVGDHHTIPPGSEDEFSEAVVRLRGCYQANDRQRAVGPAVDRAQLGLPESAIVACSFNQSWKITPAIWAIWMRLMHSHPRLLLWLLDENPWFTQNLRRHATEAGVDPDRLVFAPRVPQAEHLARLALADIALDTLPCNSHTTGSDALWMGVPMVTLVADSFAGRVGASLLHAVDLPELVTRSEDEYAAKLDALIRAPDQLARLRATLLARRDHAALFDSKSTARTLERAYTIMHERHTSGLPPTAIDLAD